MMIDVELAELKVWFQSLLDEAKKKAGSRAKLASEIGAKNPTIIDWESGSLPRLDNFVALMKYVGGDMRRAHPMWKSPTVETITIRGKVSAGDVKFSEEDAQELEVFGGIWRRSIFWAHTTGDIIYLQIDGDSMSPRFHNGAIIACRKPSDVRRLPDYTPCIFRKDDELTCKLFLRGPRPYFAMIPVNSDHATRFYKLSEVQIEYAVLGQIDASVPTSVLRAPDPEDDDLPPVRV